MECPTNPSQLRMECSKKWHGDFSCNTTGFFFFAKQTGYVTNNKQWSLMYLIYHIYCTATKQTIIIWYNYIIYIYNVYFLLFPWYHMISAFVLVKPSYLLIYWLILPFIASVLDLRCVICVLSPTSSVEHDVDLQIHQIPYRIPKESGS